LRFPQYEPIRSTRSKAGSIRTWRSLALGFVTKLTKELTEFPDGATKDLVQADWQSEWNMARILAVGRRSPGSAIVDVKLPAYLRRRQHEIPLGPEEALA
jgi:hypothetical protein